MASKVKTYSKTYSKDQAQQKAVEENKAGAAGGLNPVKAEKSKWGDTSFVRVREDDPFEVTYKKVKVENETVDPFTFDLEEDGSVVRAAPTNNAPSPSAPAARGLGRPAIPTAKVNQSSTEEHPMPMTSDDIEMVGEDLDEEPTMLKRPVRTYSRGAKKDPDASGDGYGESIAIENVAVSEELEPEPLSQKSDIFSEPQETSNIFDDDDDDLSLNKTGTARRRGEQRTYSRKKQSIKETKITSKTHILQSEDDEGSGSGPTVLNFRSQYMDPAVYSNFKYTPQEEDPVGRMNNSKVLQSSEIKHGKGSTLIVICSPKPPAEGRQTLHPVKTYKVKGSKIQLVGEEEDGPKPTPPPVNRAKREPKRSQPAATRAKRPRRKKDEDDILEEQLMEAPEVMEEQIGEEPPVLEAQMTQPVPVALVENKPRVNKIFRSRNKVEESPSPQATDILRVAAMDSEITEDVQQFSEPMVENVIPVIEKSGDDMFGFDDRQKGVEESSEDPMQMLQASNEAVSQVSVEMPEEPQMETEDLPGEEQTSEPAQNVRLAAKRVAELREQEGDAESGSSEGEFDSSQELTSDSQNSTGETKAAKDRKFFKSKSKGSSNAASKFQSPKKVSILTCKE